MKLAMEHFKLTVDPALADKVRNANIELPFAEHTPDFDRIEELTQKYHAFKNIIVIGQGGQVQPLAAVLKSFSHPKKNIYILDSQDPDELTRVLEQCPPRESFVIASSKSGNTASVIEMLCTFSKYWIVAITTEGEGTLYEIAQKDELDILAMPQPIGGRYSGTCEATYFPLALLGVDIKKFHSTAKEYYKMQSDDPLTAACALYAAEQQGYTEVFVPLYSKALSAFSTLIMQLCHESFGKENKGLTFVCTEAPESQHHTNQRFFGGRKNMVGFFVRQLHFKSNLAVQCPPQWKEVAFNGTPLEKLSLSYEEALHHEFTGTQQDATQANIPNITLSIDTTDEQSLAQLMAFWQLFAVYSSVLRDVNPYDQPQVENSKKITRKLLAS